MTVSLSPALTLFRPTGLDELLLVYESGMRVWPPRLPGQPIFYPVLNFGYAEQIARNWNTKSRSLAGYVTRFRVDRDYAANFERRIVGGREHEELWVPAERLDEFNRHIVGSIERVGAFFGEGFRGFVPEQGHLAGLDARAQFSRLSMLGTESLREEVEINHRAVFLHFPLWHSENTESGDDEPVLAGIRSAWTQRSPDVPLQYSL